MYMHALLRALSFSDEEHDVTVSSGQLMVEFPSNDDSLLAELHMATGGKSMPGTCNLYVQCIVRM